MRLFLFCLSALLLAPGWVWAAETAGTTATATSARPPAAVHSGKKQRSATTAKPSGGTKPSQKGSRRKR